MKKKKTPQYRAPKEVLKRRGRISMQTKQPADLVDWLDTKAHDAGVTRTDLVEAALTDYRNWVEKQAHA